MKWRTLAIVGLLTAAAACGYAWHRHARRGAADRLLQDDAWSTAGDVRARWSTARGGTLADFTGPVGPAGWTVSQSDIGVTKGRTYRLDARVRGKGGTLSLWTQEKGPIDAQRVAVWENVAADWTPVAAYITAAHNGKLTIRFEASAAKAGETGSVAIDDVSLAQAVLPKATQVEPDKGFDDEPSMARAKDGAYYVAWISWRDGAEAQQMARLVPTSAGSFEQEWSWPLAEGPMSIRDLRPERDGVLLTYESECDDDLFVATAYFNVNGGASVVGRRVARDVPSDRWASLDIRLEEPSAERVLTHAPTIDRRPRYVTRGDEKWLLYENVETPGYRVDFETAHHVVVAKFDGDHLLQPKNYAATSPLWDRAQSPAAAFDDKGRLWVAYRKPRLPTVGWDVYLTGWTGNAWVPPIPVSSMKGMNRTPSLVIDGNRAVICYQADDLPGGWGDIEHTKDAKSGVYLTSIELPDVPAVPHELEPLVENPAKWEAAEIRHRFGDDAPVKRETDVGGEKMTLLFGDLHSHSDTSVCERLINGSADDVYAMQRDFLNLDFACLTDHAEDFNPYLWNRNAKLARANDVPGQFTVFLGEEWASSFQSAKDKDAKHPYGYYGHRTLIFGDLRFPRWFDPQDRSTPKQLWDELRAAKVNFVSIPHQLADIGTNVPVDWDFADETAEPVAEIFQIRGSYEAKDAPRAARAGTPEPSYYWQGALKRGLVIGAIASPDHGGGVGKACVWAKENTREAILDALRARRCYGTTGARIALEVRVAGHFMGERTTDHAGSEPVEINVVARCPGEVAKISICRGGDWIHAETPASRAFDVRFIDEHPPAGPKWYYVRVEQKDGELAWSSPVWLGAGKR